MDLQVKQKKRAERVKKLEAKKAGDAAEKRNYRWAVTYQLREEEQRRRRELDRSLAASPLLSSASPSLSSFPYRSPREVW